MRFWASILAALALGTSHAADPRLLISELGDPTVAPPPVTVTNANYIATAFVPEETDAYTFIVWQKSISGDRYIRFIDVSYTTEEARSTLEGGADLPAVRDYAPIALSSGGTWSMTGLPVVYDLPADFVSEDKWKYGCFCVNVNTQTPLTITVAGTEKQVPASNQKQIFNILGTAADRSVTVSAADPSAPVDFGIGVNPIKQFFLEIVGSMDGFGEYYSYNVSNETAFVVLRCKIEPSGTQTTYHAQWRTTRGRSDQVNRTCDLWKPRAKFAKDARISITYTFFADGLEGESPYRPTQVYGAKYVPRWMSDAELDRIYDADLEVIRARHYLGE